MGNGEKPISPVLRIPTIGLRLADSPFIRIAHAKLLIPHVAKRSRWVENLNKGSSPRSSMLYGPEL